MEAERLVRLLAERGIDFFTGVPDSLLSGLCNYLMETVGIQPGRHIIAHNEGGCVALAAGHYLATGKVPCVYMQNSGIGNAVNPAASLIHPKVYGIPVLFVIGWRGEPGVHDEPQHLYQGEATLTMLDSIDVAQFVVSKDTTEEEIRIAMDGFNGLFQEGKSAALVIRKGGIAGPDGKYANGYHLVREQAIEKIIEAAGDGVLVSTTGKISRELFEIRVRRGESHGQDFLTVGSMGHSVMIALGIAQSKPGKAVWCIDGDGAMLMHTGALATVGSQRPENLVHIVLNNAAHESVGGAPTVAKSVDMPAAAKALGYREAVSVTDEGELAIALKRCANLKGPVFVEVKVSLGSRDDLGRPTVSPAENKEALMRFLKCPKGGPA